MIKHPSFYQWPSIIRKLTKFSQKETCYYHCVFNEQIFWIHWASSKGPNQILMWLWVSFRTTLHSKALWTFKSVFQYFFKSSLKQRAYEEINFLWHKSDNFVDSCIMFVFTNVPASDQHPGDNQIIYSMKICPLNLKLFK